MIVSQSASVLQNSFADMWYTVAQFLPSILAAAVIFIIGWIVGIVLYRVVEQVAKVLRIDEALKAAGVNDFLLTSRGILVFSRVTVFLQQVVLLYLPQVILAVLILVLAAVVAEAAKNIIAG